MNRWILSSSRIIPVVLAMALGSSWAVEKPADAPKPKPIAPAVTPPKPVQDETTVNAVKNDNGMPVKEGANGSQPQSADGADLRTLIGVNPHGLKRAEVPRLPPMTVRGFVQPHGQPPLALLEIGDSNRTFLVQIGTEIPITVVGRISPVGRSELTGLNAPGKSLVPQVRTADGQEQSQVILKVIKVSGQGVTVEAGLLSQTIIVR